MLAVNEWRCRWSMTNYGQRSDESTVLNWTGGCLMSNASSNHTSHSLSSDKGELHHHKDNVLTNQIWRVGLVWVKSLVTQNGVSCSPDKTMQCILRVISKVNLFWSHLYPIQSIYIALCWSKYGISNVTGQNMQDLMPPFLRPGIRLVTMICPLPATDTTTPTQC